jgi:hypothetical protein
MELEEQNIGSAPFLNYLEREGTLLGYPKCCVHWVLEHRRSNKSIEDAALAALIADQYAFSSDATNISSPEFAYFAFEFHPCDPRCEAAEQIGKSILTRYEKVDTTLSDFYRQHILPLNKAKICVRSEQYRYHDFIQKFDAEIYHKSHPGWQRFFRTTKRYLANQFSKSKGPYDSWTVFRIFSMV